MTTSNSVFQFLTSTALSLLIMASVSGVAHATLNRPFEVSVRGFFTAGVAAVSSDIDGQEENDFLQNAEIHFKAKVELDGGTELGIQIELEGEESSDQIDEHYIYAKGLWGKAILGAENGVGHLGEVTAPAFIPGLKTYNNSFSDVVIERALPGIDDEHMSTKIEHVSGDAPKITYFSPRLAGVQIGVSYAPNNNNTEGGESNFAVRTRQKNIFEYSINYQYTFGKNGGFEIAYTHLNSTNTSDFLAARVADDTARLARAAAIVTAGGQATFDTLTMGAQMAAITATEAGVADAARMAAQARTSAPSSKGLGLSVRYGAYHVGVNQTFYNDFEGHAGTDVETFNFGFAYDINAKHRIGISWTSSEESGGGRNNDLDYKEITLGGGWNVAKGVGFGYYYQDARVDFVDATKRDLNVSVIGVLISLKF